MNGNTIRYGVTNPVIFKTYCISRAAIKSPINYLKSFIKDPALQTREVTAIMCVWDEQENAGRAISSSHEFVDKYLVIDKNGETIPKIKEIQDEYNLDIDYYTKPSLNLFESRKFAVEKVKSDWLLIQDGDEVFNDAKGEANSIFNLKQFMLYPNIALRTRMNVLKLDFLHTQSVNNAHHNFFLHNNGGIHFDKTDIPRYKGRVIFLGPIYKWNLSMVKNMRRIYYRNTFWGKYEHSGLTDKYLSISEFVEKHLNVEVTQEEIDEYEQRLMQTAIPYDKEIQGELPRILRDLVSRGIIK